ncbi:tetratricopeptide repeat protein [Microbacterium shaanxiense]
MDDTSDHSIEDGPSTTGTDRRLAEARSLIALGEQGAARALLNTALAETPTSRDADEAYAIAEMTGLLVELDVEIEPAWVVDAHLARMEALTSKFDDARTSEARAVAELRRIEFVHVLDDIDPVLHVEVLQRAQEADARFRASAHVGVRRAAAEAALTAQMIRRWLGQDPGSIAIALDELALRLGGERDSRMSTIRAEAMVTSARLRIESDLDLAGVPEMLRLAAEESFQIPESEGLGLDASLLLADLAIADGAPPIEAVADARLLLAGDVRTHGVRRARASVRHLQRILGRLEPEHYEAVATAEWQGMLDRYAGSADPDVRSAVLVDLVHQVGPAEAVTSSGLSALRYADRLFRADQDPGSAIARFAVAAKIAGVIGHPDGAAPTRDQRLPVRDPAESVRLSAQVEERFDALWTDQETVPAMAALLLDRALRLSDIGRRDEALATLARLEANVRAHDTARPERAQAAYWTSRFLREADELEASRRAINDALAEFADDPSGDVRLWAANTLWSAWRSDGIHQEEAEALRHTFSERFGQDPDIRIRRLDATRRLGAGVDAHEQGDTRRAITTFEELERHFGDAEDEDIQDTVRRAKENLRILMLLPIGETAPSDAATARYRSLRDRLYAADKLAEHGQIAEAEQTWSAIVAETAGSDDADLAMLRLAALDAWAGCVQDAGYWEQVAALARQATVIRSGADLRAERVQIRAHLRLGMALAKLGDPRGAIAAYETLDALAAGSSDSDVSVARQQAVYNRAVMIDDIGDTARALDAYEHVVAVHGQSIDSPSGRLRCAKALRNQALIFAGLGRPAEAAGAHRRVLDLAAGSTDPQLLERVKSSAFDLARCFTALGEHASAASTYAWISAAPHVSTSGHERRAAARAEKRSRRMAR